MKYYLWLGMVRFELPRPLTLWERFRCLLSPWVYQIEEINGE